MSVDLRIGLFVNRRTTVRLTRIAVSFSAVSDQYFRSGGNSCMIAGSDKTIESSTCQRGWTVIALGAVGQ